MVKSHRSILRKWCNIVIMIVAIVLAVCILPALASALTCDCGDICVDTDGWWRNGGVFNGSGTPIQAAVDNAGSGETIYVWNGSYSENVNVDKSLKLQGKGADVVTVTAASTSNHVFYVTADYVNISGFNVTGAITDKAGFYLTNNQHCNISNNNAAGNNQGIYLLSSSNNTLTSNTASNNNNGIRLDYSSSNNTLMNNTASLNNYGIFLFSSSNYNELTSNTASNNSQRGIYLHSSSNYNTLTSNTASNNNNGIRLDYSSSNNTLMNNTASLNNYGIFLFSSSNYNELTSNTASNNSQRGIYLHSSSNYNTLTSNTASNNNNGIRLDYSSSNNTLMNNTASLNNYGIFLFSSSNYNELMSNTASNNSQRGIYLYSSNNNQIYNNYFNNTNNAYDNGNNTWNTTPTTGTNIIGGSHLGGNYWSNYAGNDTNGNGLGDTLTPYNSSGNIENGGDYHPLATTSSAAPSITSFAPPTSVCNTAGAIRTFNITIDQIVNVTWYINGTNIQDTNTSVMTSNYTNTSAEIGVWNVSVVAKNANGTDMKTWVWNVTAAPTYTPSDPTNLANTTGNFWVNHTWQVGSGNVTDSYNVSVNGVWNNRTETFLISSVGAGNWSNITVWAWNKTGSGNMSAGNVSDNVKAPAAQQTFNCTSGDICINTSGWWRGGGVLNSSCTPIQAAVNNATAGETIYVWNGSYSENVNVDKRVTLRGEGADVVTVTNSTANHHVFTVTEDYVNISGFTVIGATGSLKAGIYLNGRQHCNISDNIALDNEGGIWLDNSSNNTLTSNTANSNSNYGIYLSSSSHNTIFNNYFNNTYNAWDNGNNTWNTTPTAGTNIIGGSHLSGNYWSDYAGNDTNGDGLGDTLTPYNSSGNIVRGGDFHPLVTPGFAAPNITSSAPESPVNDTYGNWTKFNISVDQTVNVTWYLNVTPQTPENESVTEANYTVYAEYVGEHNVSAVAENANGTDMKTWAWNVTKETTLPVITNGSISGLVTDSSTGCPIRDATVSAGTTSACTGTDGTYTIPSIAPDTYSLNATATGYAWNNSTVVIVSSGAINTSGNVALTPDKVTLSPGSGETTIIKSSSNGTKVIFNLSATNYGTNATFTVTNSSNATVVTGCSSFILNSSENKDFNITATDQTAGYYPVKITVSNSSLSKSASITLYAIMQNMSANYTADEGSNANTTNNASVTGNSVLVNSTVDTGANVNNSTLVHANVTDGANVTGGSLVKHSIVTGSSSRVENGSVVEHSTVDNSTVDKGAIVRNSTVMDSTLYNTTITDSELYENTTITDSTVVNVTANNSTISGVEIDTGYDIILINATVVASTSSGSAGRPEIQGNTNAIAITCGIIFTNIYTDVLIEDLVLQQTDDIIVRKNTPTTINASNTVKCDLTVNMPEPVSINITETGINPEGEGTDDISGLVQVENFLCIQHNASSNIGNFTIRRYYDPSLNYIEVYIYYYNTTPDPDLWERLQTTASGTKDGLNWTETIVNHLSTYVLMGRLADDGVSTDNRRGGSGGPYITSTPAVLATEVQMDIPVTGDMAAPGEIGMDTGTDESTPIQTGKKGMIIFGLVGVIVSAIIIVLAIVLVMRRKNT